MRNNTTLADTNTFRSNKNLLIPFVLPLLLFLACQVAMASVAPARHHLQQRQQQHPTPGTPLEQQQGLRTR